MFNKSTIAVVATEARQPSAISNPRAHGGPQRIVGRAWIPSTTGGPLTPDDAPPLTPDLASLVAMGMLTEAQARQMMPTTASAPSTAATDEGSDVSDELGEAELAAAIALSMQPPPGGSSAVEAKEEMRGEQAMRAWLRGLGLEHCHDALVEWGFDDLDTIVLLEPGDLHGTPIDNADRPRLLAAVGALRAGR